MRQFLTSIPAFFESCLRPQATDSTASTTDKLHLACAALLLELANADHDMEETEKRKILDILGSTLALEADMLENLWQLAHDERHAATSLYQFTSLVNEAYGYAEKNQLLRHMWEVARADGRIDRYEEHLIRKVADLLHLTHGDFIRAKLATKPDFSTGA